MDGFFRNVTDHRPLLGTFTTAKPVPNVISNTVLRRSIFLNAYNFDVVYLKGSKLGNVDFLSQRQTKTVEKLSPAEDVQMIELAGTILCLTYRITKGVN